MEEIRVIGQVDVESLLDHGQLMEAVATALRQLSAGEASVPPRIATFTEHGLIAAMPGYLPGSHVAVKLVSVFPGNAEHDRPTHQAIVVVFDPATIIDHATFEKPHQYATGVQHVFVNGVQVLKNGEHTGAKPGRVVRGPGYRGGRMRIPTTPDPESRT